METSEISTTTPKRQRQAEYYQSHHGSSSDPKHTFVDDHLQESVIKRHKPCNNNIITLNMLIDEDEQEQHEKDEASDQHLSAIFTTLERELSSSSSSSYSHGSQRRPLNITSNINNTVISDLSQLEYYQDVETANDGSVATSAGDGDDNVKSVMRHLLEASDDELGIPNNCNGNENNDENSNSFNYNNNDDDQSGENCISTAPFGFDGERGFWEIEDEVANYYTELHSQLFM